jgi:hypothetical protein
MARIISHFPDSDKSQPCHKYMVKTLCLHEANRFKSVKFNTNTEKILKRTLYCFFPTVVYGYNVPEICILKLELQIIQSY